MRLTKLFLHVSPLLSPLPPTISQFLVTYHHDINKVDELPPEILPSNVVDPALAPKGIQVPPGCQPGSGFNGIGTGGVFFNGDIIQSYQVWGDPGRTYSASFHLIVYVLDLIESIVSIDNYGQSLLIDGFAVRSNRFGARTLLNIYTDYCVGTDRTWSLRHASLRRMESGGRHSGITTRSAFVPSLRNVFPLFSRFPNSTD